MKDRNAPRPFITAIVTSYFEEKSLVEFHRRLSQALVHVGRPYEIVMINDGSTDRTWDIMRELYEADPQVRVIIDFFKNSGQLAAMTAGVCEARGEVILFIDSDLQLDPEDLPRLVAEFDNGVDLVSGYRENRQDSLLRIIPSKLANAIMRKASNSKLRDFGCTFKLYHASLLKGLDLGPFKLYNTASAIARIARYAEVPVNHHARPYEKSGWTFRKLWKFNMENLVNISERPFQILGLLGFAGALLFAIRLSFEIVLPFRVLNEVTTGLILNALVIGFFALFGTLCLIGEFGIRSFMASQRYPHYVIREVLRKEE